METRVNVEEGKKYLYVETTEEGIKQFKNAPEAERAGIEISKMRVEGVWVPAFKFAVETSTESGAQFYADWKQEEWRQESQYRMENRCEICGSNGKSMRCPLRVANPDYTGAPGQKKTIAVKCEECPFGYNRLFRPMNGKLNCSTLDVQDGEGNVDSFEPESKKYSNADTYIRLLKDLGDYVTEHYPKYAKYVELINLLGSEYDMKTASQIMGKADSTLYDWVKRLRPIYDEFRGTIDYL